MTDEPARHWAELHMRGNLSAVGQSAYSPAWNRWLYRSWLETGQTFLVRHGVSAGAVCEVGAGTGAWFPVWRAIGASHITAVDIVDVDVPADRCLQLDIGEPCELGAFDLVAAMYVLLHITDQERFDIAVTNLARMVAPKGWLVIAEPIRVRGPLPARARADSVVRNLDAYTFDGLELVALEAATVLAGNPVERPSALARGAFGAVMRVGSRVPTILGPAIARIDPWLVRHTSWAPSSKLALYRRA